MLEYLPYVFYTYCMLSILQQWFQQKKHKQSTVIYYTYITVDHITCKAQCHHCLFVSRYRWTNAQKPISERND